MKKYRPLFMVLLWLVALSLVGWVLVRNAHFDVLHPTGDIGVQERNLLIFTLGLSLVVIVPVFIMLGLFAWKYREGAKATYTPDWDSNTKLEFLWWGIPVFIIGILSVVTWHTSHTLDPYRAIASTQKPLEVQVVALQWKWLFIYPEEGVASVNDLTIPVNRPIHFSLTADAPMSAFWIPSLGSQIYSMNAMSSQLHLIANREGVYKGYNTNINGAGYASMVFDANVLSEKNYTDWVDKYHSSGMELTPAHFQELTTPSTMPEPMHMQLKDKNFYNSIIMKSMPTMKHDDSMKDMQGMM